MPSDCLKNQTVGQKVKGKNVISRRDHQGYPVFDVRHFQNFSFSKFFQK